MGGLGMDQIEAPNGRRPPHRLGEGFQIKLGGFTEVGEGLHLGLALAGGELHGLKISGSGRLTNGHLRRISIPRSSAGRRARGWG